MAMKTKSVAIVAGVVLALGATATWQWQRSERSLRPRAPLAPQSQPVDSATTESARAIDGARVADLPADAAPPPVASDATSTVIPVEVVNASGEPCRSGRIHGSWREFPPPGASGEFDEQIADFEPSRAFDVAIDGDVTELRLPATTRLVTISASVAAFSPTSVRKVIDRESEPTARRGEPHRWRPLRLIVGESSPDTALRGRVTVDGVARVPLGLTLTPGWDNVVLEEEGVRIHALDATYRLAPRPTGEGTLWVTSDETVPRRFDIDDDDTEVDLALTSGRRLELTLLDRRTGRIAPGVELHVDTAVIVERTFFRESWRNHGRYVRSGRDGVARMAGLPEIGRVEVRRDGSMDVRGAPRDSGTALGSGVRMATLKEPVRTLALDEDSADVVRATLRIDLERSTRRVFGTVPREWLEAGANGEGTLQLFWAKAVANERPQRRDLAIELTAEGGWSLEVAPGSNYLVWAERDLLRASKVARVEVGEEDVGPIALALRPGSDVVLRVRSCPTGGYLHLDVSDPDEVTPLATTVPLHGGTFERRLRLEVPTEIEVGWSEQRDGEAGVKQRKRVDPATTAMVEFELAAGDARDLLFATDRASDHVALPEDSLLLLLRVDERGALDTESRALVALRGAKSREPVAIAAGRWLWVVVGDVRGVLAGVADVPPFAVGVPITLHAAVEERAAIEIGRGFTVEAIDGVEIPAQLRRVLQWVALGKPASDAPILVPRGARIALREE